MCIIATKPYGVSTLDESLFENCFENNPDGAGFAFCVRGDKAIRYRKGYMTYKAFKSALDKIVLDRYNLVDVQLMLHYRITTHGGTRQANTHPFPISNKDEQLTSLKGRVSSICCMNGIVSAEIPKDSTFSDTMQFIKDKLAILSAVNPSFYKVKAFADYIKASGAKWSFMDTENIYNFGAFVEHDGWHYSNSNYEKDLWSTYKWNPSYYDSLSYGHSSVVGEETEFEGVLVLDNGDMLEIDFTDDIYITDKDTMLQYDYEADSLLELTNVVEILDNNYFPTSYRKIVGAVYYD